MLRSVAGPDQLDDGPAFRPYTFEPCPDGTRMEMASRGPAHIYTGHKQDQVAAVAQYLQTTAGRYKALAEERAGRQYSAG